VCGFNEQTLAPDDTDPFRTNCTSERVRAIVQTCLDAPVSCEVVTATSSAAFSRLLAGACRVVFRGGWRGPGPVASCSIRTDAGRILGRR
jgi:hypothetical protein